jgi:hypothetical protein
MSIPRGPLSFLQPAGRYNSFCILFRYLDGQSRLLVTEKMPYRSAYRDREQTGFSLAGPASAL